MKQHISALEEIEFKLATSGYRNRTASIAEFGRYAAVVGAAYDYYAVADSIAARAGYSHPRLNEEAAEAYHAYEIIRDLAKTWRTPTTAWGYCDERMRLLRA